MKKQGSQSRHHLWPTPVFHHFAANTPSTPSRSRWTRHAEQLPRRASTCRYISSIASRFPIRGYGTTLPAEPPSRRKSACSSTSGLSMRALLSIMASMMISPISACSSHQCLPSCAHAYDPFFSPRGGEPVALGKDSNGYTVQYLSSYIHDYLHPQAGPWRPLISERGTTGHLAFKTSSVCYLRADPRRPVRRDGASGSECCSQTSSHLHLTPLWVKIFVLLF